MVINKSMEVLENKYLKFIDFVDIQNWSVQYLKWTVFSYDKKFELVSIWDFLKKNKTAIQIEDWKEYIRVKVKMNNKWVLLRDTEIGDKIWTKKQFIVEWGEFIMSKIDARNWAFWIVPNELKWAIITNDFPSFIVDEGKLNLQFFILLTSTKEFLKFAQHCSSWTTWRQRINMDLFLNVKIPIPSIQGQNKIVENYNKKLEKAKEAEKRVEFLEKKVDNYLMEELGIEIEEGREKGDKKLEFINFFDIKEWWVDKIIWLWKFKSNKFDLINFDRDFELFEDIKRWKSPKYSSNSNSIILNQKCNRWDKIDLQYWKTVDEKWLSGISNSILTKENDILINSTWEWTIWRASLIRKWFEGLLFDSHLLLLRLNQNKVNSQFFTLFFNSFIWQKQVDSIKSAQATKQTELWVWNLKKIKFPLPPLKIQEKIVKHISELKEEMKNLKSLIGNLRKSAKKEFEEEIFSK